MKMALLTLTLLMVAKPSAGQEVYQGDSAAEVIVQGDILAVELMGTAGWHLLINNRGALYTCSAPLPSADLLWAKCVKL